MANKKDETEVPGKSLRQRVEDCEKEVVQLSAFVKAVLKSVGESMVRVGEQLEVRRRESGAAMLAIEAAGNLLGEGPFTVEIDRLTRDHASKRLVTAVAEGKIRAAEKAGPGTILVGRLYDKDGQLMRPGRWELAFDQTEKEGQDRLLDAIVGQTIEDEGERYEIDGIYEIVAAKAPDAE